MKTIVDIETKVNEILKDFCPYRFPFVVKEINSSRQNGSVGFNVIKKGITYTEDKNTICLKINSRLLRAGNEKRLERTIAHEVYHMIQLEMYSEREYRDKKATYIGENDVTAYAPNVLELEAEVFTINLLGRSNHSWVNAKQSDLYKKTLTDILNHQTI